MPLTELQSGGLVAPWRDKQQAATGIRGIQMTLTVHAFFHTFDTVAEAQKLQRHQWNSLYSCEMKKKKCAEDHRVTVWPQNNACDRDVLQEYLFIGIMGVDFVFVFVFARKKVCPFLTVP